LRLTRVIDALRPLTPEHVVKGQYAEYPEVDGVETDKTAETYVASRTVLNSWRWAEVPTTIRADKALAVTATEVVVRFRRAPLQRLRRVRCVRFTRGG
ncbi:MAG TPA: hypothetical protein VI094_16315, partial [Propionibacteriaceae bacterium]